MGEIKTFNFTPISNERQQIHAISFSERIRKGGTGILNPHRTSFYILLFVTRGRSKHLIDFEVHDIRKGDFFFIRPGQVHAFFPSHDSDGIIIAFTEDFLLQSSNYHVKSAHLEALSELSLGCLFPLSDEERENVDTQIRMIRQELSNSYDALQESILQSYLSSLLLVLLRIKQENQQLSPKRGKELLYALQFKSLIERCCNRRSTVLEYATELGISTRILRKITELHFGKCPKTIIQETVLLESKRMLIDRSLTVKEISYNLGYDEPTNFTKFFKKFTSMSPEQFRESRS